MSLPNVLLLAMDATTVDQYLSMLSVAPTALIEAAIRAWKIEAGPAADAERARLPIRMEENVAVISLRGVVMKNYLARPVKAALQAAVADEQVDAIVLRIDSPGGAVDGTSEMADAIAEAKRKKPVIASVDGLAASAAYWAASQASEIYAESNSTLIGSIGVRVLLNDWSGFFAKHGIKAVPVDTGEFKSAGAMGTEITETQRGAFQELIDAVFEDFKAAVMTGRALDEKKIATVADGRVFRAKEAQALGLIDGIRSFEATIGALKRPDNRGRSTAVARAKLQLANY